MTSAYRASLPVPDPTKSFWSTSEHATHWLSEGSKGSLTDDVDICIIGSGITGVSTAYHLAKILQTQHLERDGGIKVAILEAREFCSGATGRNGGHLTETRQIFSEFSRVEHQQGVDEAVRNNALEHHNVEGIIAFLREYQLEDHVDFVQGGLLTVFVTEEEYDITRRQYEAAKEAGLNVDGIEWLTKDQSYKRFGTSFPAMISLGNNLWPLKLVASLYNTAKGLGASESSTVLDLSLHTNTPVTEVVRISHEASQDSRFPRRYSLSTPRGPITCSYVLHATNAYVSHLLPHMGGPDGVVPTRGQVIATRSAVTSDVLTTIAGSANEDYEYWFPRPVKADSVGEITSEGRPLIILGGGREVTLPDGESYLTDDSTLNPKVSKFLREFLPRTFPGRYEVGNEPEMEWTGIMGFTKSTDPFVGPVVDRSNPQSDKLFEGQYVSAGYTGHGMPRAFACAEAIAQMIIADMAGKQWEAPEWFPKSYLCR